MKKIFYLLFIVCFSLPSYSQKELIIINPPVNTDIGIESAIIHYEEIDTSFLIAFLKDSLPYDLYLNWYYDMVLRNDLGNGPIMINKKDYLTIDSIIKKKLNNIFCGNDTTMTSADFTITSIDSSGKIKYSCNLCGYCLNKDSSSYTSIDYFKTFLGEIKEYDPSGEVGKRIRLIIFDLLEEYTYRKK